MSALNNQPVVLANDLDPQRHQLYMNSRYLAVDTETRGLRVHRDRLCLVQMCNEAGLTTLVQIPQKNPSAPLMAELLAAKNVEKIFHFARFDLAALKHWLGCKVQPVFCTRTASRLIRTYTDQHGLKDLVKELLGIELNKEQQSSDWAVKKLSPPQVDYAAADVTHLVSLKEKLVVMLEREHRLDLALSCMAFLPIRAELDLAGWEDQDIFAHH